LREIHAVEEVENVGTNLQREALSDFHDFCKLGIDVRQPRADESVAAQVALAAKGRRWKCRGGSETLDESASACG